MTEARYRDAERRLWAWHGADPIERRLQLATSGRAVRVQELGDGPPIIFLHGALTSGLSWASLAARLTGFRCIVVDRPGTGLSEPLAERLDVHNVPRIVETFVVDLLDALGLESAHLAANSLGGYIALRTAAAHPDRIDRMIQYSWPVGVETSNVPWLVRVLSLPGAGPLIASLPPSERALRLILRMIGGGANLDAGRLDADIPAYVALFRDTDTLRNELTQARAFVSPRRGLDRLVLPDTLLEMIRTPTYLLWGEDDGFGGARSARRMAALMPNAQLELLPGVGHTPWFDDLDHCVEVTRRFLNAPS